MAPSVVTERQHFRDPWGARPSGASRPTHSPGPRSSARILQVPWPCPAAPVASLTFQELPGSHLAWVATPGLSTQRPRHPRQNSVQFRPEAPCGVFPLRFAPQFTPSELRDHVPACCTPLQLDSRRAVLGYDPETLRGAEGTQPASVSPGPEPRPPAPEATVVTNRSLGPQGLPPTPCWAPGELELPCFCHSYPETPTWVPSPSLLQHKILAHHLSAA